MWVHDKSKTKWPVRMAFVAASLGIAAATWWGVMYNNVPQQPLTPEQQAKLKSVPSRHPAIKSGEDSFGFIRKHVPDQKIDAASSQMTTAGVNTAKPKQQSPQEPEDKEVMRNLVKDLYGELLNETDPVKRYDHVALMRSTVVHAGDDALSSIGMTRDQLEGLVRSVQAQAGPVALENIKKMDKYDPEKIELVVTMIEIANSLSSGDRGRYYESLGSSREELQNHYCDGVIATVRRDMAFALSNKADKMTYNTYTYQFMSYIESLARMMPDGYSKVCEAAGRNVYQESGISDQQIKQLLTFKPEIIPE